MPKISKKLAAKRKIAKKMIESNKTVAGKEKRLIARSISIRGDNLCVAEWLEKKKLSEYYFVDTGFECKALAIGIINNDTPLINCAHLRIGSSQIDDLLKSDLTPRSTHSFYLSGANRSIGDVAEQAARIMNPGGRRVTKASGSLPFLCATPDITFDDKLIEVKSGDNALSKTSILQLAIAMEIFSVEKAELWVFKVEGNKATLETVVYFEKNTTMFTEEFVHYAIFGYINYITILLNSMDIKVTPVNREELLQLFKLNFKRNKPAFELSSMISTKLCKEVLPFTKFKHGEPIKAKKGKIWESAEIRFNGFLSNQTHNKLGVDVIANNRNIDIISDIASNFLISGRAANEDAFREITQFIPKPDRPQKDLVVNIVDNRKVGKLIIDDCFIESIYEYYRKPLIIYEKKNA